MKTVQDMLRCGVDRNEYSRIPHVICLADFDTNQPNANRISRIASEINEYMRNKNKYALTLNKNLTE